jgi:glycosyltransferase involved in cell wall biosynthesis
VRSEKDLGQPAVSVVLPTWRRYASGTLQRAVDSVLDQSFRDLELIVVDDGSTDGTWDYLRERQARDARIVLIRHERNSGLPAIRVNEGIEVSRGRYLAFQFDDDEWLEGALEMLVLRAESLSEPSVVYGEALLVFPDGREHRYPGVDVNLLTLFRQNRLLNNTALVPRSVLELCGLYDCHIAMRRMCDWDLWIRCVRQVPFVPAGGLVGRGYVASDSNAIGVVAPYDAPIVRFLMALPRNGLLSPARWREYEVDALSLAGVEIPGTFRDRLVLEQIRPYHERWKVPGSIDRSPPALAPGPAGHARTLACLLDDCYPPTDFCFGHYDGPTRTRRTYVRFEQLLHQVAPTWPAETDLVLFVRTLGDPAPELARRAVSEGVPSAYYLDDDFLSLHEYGPRYDILAPGRPLRANLVSALEEVDAVWATSPVIAESVRPHNARIVPHNNSVPEAWLPDRLRPRGAGGRIRIAHAGSSYRIQEFEAIWEGLRQFAREFSDAVEFQFWGVDVSGLPALEAPTTQVPYTTSYLAFMTRLRRAGFDVLFTPLLDHPRPRLAKSPCKYYEVAAAGAFGIFSDVPPYASLPHGLTCLKAPNTPEAWYEALRDALSMPEERFDLMRRRLIEHVRLEFTETAQIHLHEAACRATEFHRRTRGNRHADGRPRVLVPAASRADRQRAAALEAVLRRYAIEPVAGPSDDRATAPGLEELLARERPALALVPREPSAGAKAFRERGFPFIRVPEVVLGQDCFARGLGKLLRDTGLDDSGRRRQVVAVPNGLEEVVEQRMKRQAESAEIRRFDAADTLDLSDVDILVAGAAETTLLARAAAEGVLRVFVPGAEVSDSTDDGSGIVSKAPTAEAVAEAIRRALDLSSRDRLALRTAAYRAVRARAHPDAVANELLSRFDDALEKSEQRSPTFLSAEAGSVPPAPLVQGSSAARARLKAVLDRAGLYRPISRLYWRTQRRRVLVVHEDTVGLESYHRAVLRDLEAATRRSCILRSAADVDPRFLYSFQCVMFIGGASEKSLQILEAARKFGCATVYEADDNLHSLPVVEAMLRRVDVIQVSSESAVPILRRFNPNVVSIVPFELLTPSELPARRHQGPVTVGVLGAPDDEEDFEPLLPAVSRLLDEGRPLRVEFFGFVPRELAAREEITVYPWEREYRKFREKLDGFRWDIGLAPMRDTELNRCKSNARYREYASSGIAGIYSNAPIYRDTVAPRRTGLLVPHGSTQAWYDAIVELATDESLRTDLASRAFEDVRTNYRREDYARRVALLLESLDSRRRRGGIG